MMKIKYLIWIVLLAVLCEVSKVSADSPKKLALPGDGATIHEQKTTPRKSYVLLSLILPGTGEWFIGSKSTAKFFWGTEVGLWATYLGIKAYTNILQEDFKSFAAVHAGVYTANKTDQFWIDVGNSSDIYTFNEKKRVERNLGATYEETKENVWVWDSDEHRAQFNEIRFKQHNWKQRLNIAIAGLILNRIISAVDVIRLIRKAQKSEKKQHSRLYFDYIHNPIHGQTYRLNFKVYW